MICKECENVIEYCEKCGKPIYKSGQYFPTYPMFPDPNKVWCSGTTCENKFSPEGFLSMLTKSINDSNIRR